MLIWHLPVVPTQPLQVVLIWRDHSASLYDKFSSAVVDAEELLAGKRERTSKSKNKRNLNTGNNAWEQNTDLHRKGIVMEIAKSDLDTSHMLQYLQVTLSLQLTLSSLLTLNVLITNQTRTTQSGIFGCAELTICTPPGNNDERCTACFVLRSLIDRVHTHDSATCQITGHLLPRASTHHSLALIAD